MASRATEPFGLDPFGLQQAAIVQADQERIERAGAEAGQLRQIAGEGSPMPLCPPGQNCSGHFRKVAGEALPADVTLMGIAG